MALTHPYTAAAARKGRWTTRAQAPIALWPPNITAWTAAPIAAPVARRQPSARPYRACPRASLPAFLAFNWIANCVAACSASPSDQRSAALFKLRLRCAAAIQRTPCCGCRRWNDRPRRRQRRHWHHHLHACEPTQNRFDQIELARYAVNGKTCEALEAWVGARFAPKVLGTARAGEHSRKRSASGIDTN